MKKILFLLTFIGILAALGVAGYFASKTREIFEGHVHFEGKDVVGHTHVVPIPGVTISLFESSAVDEWLADPMVVKLLNWKDLDRELEMLDDLLSLYQSLETIYKPNSPLGLNHRNRSAKIAEYSSQLQSPILAANSTFPESLFKQLRESIPESIFEATLSIFVSERDSFKAPVNQSFYEYFEKQFPEMSSFMFETLRNKLDTNPWDKYIGYNPRFTSTEAANIIHQFIEIDKIAHRMIQIAVTEKKIIDKVPEPVSMQQTDLDGMVQFKINRYTKNLKVNSTTEFVAIAVSHNTSVHPGKVYAWLKSVSINLDDLLSEEKLPFFPAKQSFLLSNKTASAEIGNQSIKHPPKLPGSALQPLKFGKGSDKETKFLAISYLSKRGMGAGSTHGSSLIHTTFGSHDHHSNHSPIPKPDFELLDKPPSHKTPPRQEINTVDQIVSIPPKPDPSSSKPKPSIPIPPQESSLDDEMAVLEKLLDDSAPIADNSVSRPKVSDATIEASQIHGTWVNIEEQQTYKFGEKNSFALSLEGFEVLSGYYNLDHSGAYNIMNLVDHSDGAIIPALIKLESQNELKLQMGIKEKEPPTDFSPEALLFRRIK